MHALAVLAVLRILAPTPPALPPAPALSRTPEELVERVQARLAAGSLEDFRAVYPFQDGLEPVTSALKDDRNRKPGLGRVLRSDGDRAVLLLSGVSLSANSGDDILRSLQLLGPLRSRARPRRLDACPSPPHRRGQPNPPADPRRDGGARGVIGRHRPAGSADRR